MFRPFKNIPVADQEIEEAVIANSTTLSIGDAIIPASTAANSAFVVGATNTTGSILGVVVGFYPITQTSSGTTQTLEQSTFTTASNNQTVAKVGVKYIPARLVDKWLVDISAAAGTTTGSAGVGYFNISASLNNTLNEASYVIFTGTPGQFTSLGVATNYGPNYLNTQVVGFFNKVV
ncbi:unnamed protein product [Sphagnum balticum]